jgi:hypothetical protein
VVDRILGRGRDGKDGKDGRESRDQHDGRTGRDAGSPDPAGAVVAAADPKGAVWARVQLARNLRRPRILEILGVIADDFIELHGDRVFGDDEAIVAGFARIDGHRVAVIGQQKGAGRRCASWSSPSAPACRS